MNTKTIRLRTDVYERLAARRRDDESISELLERLLDESASDWRDGFGTLSDDEASELETIASRSRSDSSQGLSNRQKRIEDEIDDR